MHEPASDGPTRILLASASPRRRRLLAWLGLDYAIASVDTPEELDSPLACDPPALAAHLAAEKALAARAEQVAGSAGALVLAFDTIVVLDGRILGKPADVADAWRMLRALSGRVHQVVTGCAMLPPGSPGAVTFAVTTDVRMQELSDERIEEWMASGEFMGCAGAYNIEGQVAEVTTDECYQNVAGLPLCHLFAAMRYHGLAPDAQLPVGACDAALTRSCRLGRRVTATDAIGA